MDYIEMLEEMNEKTEGTLSVTHYSEWEINSYRKGTLLYKPASPVFEFIGKGKDLKTLIKDVYKKFKEKEKTADKERINKKAQLKNKIVIKTLNSY